MVAQSHIQYSFNSGEWAPALNARVDLAKYKSGAALLQNYFVDYRGGASSRAGTKYILQARTSSKAVRLIPFQASVSVGYILEFGDLYIRFYNNGAPILEAATTISGATQASPGVIHDVAHGYSPGDWVFILAVVGMTQLNGNYYIINTVPDADHYTLKDLFGSVVNTVAFGAYVSGGTAQRVYTLPSPYLAADLALIKFAQNVDKLILCNTSYAPQVLTLIASNNWTLNAITFGTTVGTPSGLVAATTLSSGTVNYSYLVTAVDANGQESGVSTPVALNSKTDLRTVAGTNRITWNAVSGASSYNVYKAELSYINIVAAGAQYGFIGNVTGVTFDDSNIAPDFSQTPPIAQNPFVGSPVDHLTITTPGNYTTVPSITIAAPASGATATASAVLQVTGTPGGAASGGSNWAVGDLSFYSNGVVLVAATVDAGFNVTSWRPIGFPGTSGGSISSGSTPVGSQIGSGPNGGGGFSNATFVWGVGIITMINHGSGYTAAPAVTFSSGAAAATAVLGAASAGNPAVPGFFQQRLVLAGQTTAPQSFFMSQPGSYYNFDTTDPAQADDGIYGALVSGQLNTIKSMISQPNGLILLSDKASWLVNGGGSGTAIDATNPVANAQSFSGASDVPPIVSNYDILFVQAKNSIVRDNSFNFYANVFTGTDISVISSHLFYGFQVLEWAWAEEPFKIVWGIRNDGTLLSLTFLKEQEFIGWAHSVTQGLFKSVATITESTASAGIVDAIYLVVERTINGQTLQYIERMAERIFPNGATDAWCVDAGIQYSGAPATTFTGAQQLAGATVTGLADGVVIPPFAMPTNGTFVLANAASKVTVGLAFTPALQTLALDLGEPTIQGKPKKIVGVTVRVEDTLGLTIGSDASHQVVMKDLVVGNVSTTLTGQSSQMILGLVTGDAYTKLDPTYTIPGQYYINQPNPLPCSILGVIPQIIVGDTK